MAHATPTPGTTAEVHSEPLRLTADDSLWRSVQAWFQTRTGTTVRAWCPGTADTAAEAFALATLAASCGVDLDVLVTDPDPAALERAAQRPRHSPATMRFRPDAIEDVLAGVERFDLIHLGGLAGQDWRAVVARVDAGLRADHCHPAGLTPDASSPRVANPHS